MDGFIDPSKLNRGQQQAERLIQLCKFAAAITVGLPHHPRAKLKSGRARKNGIGIRRITRDLDLTRADLTAGSRWARRGRRRGSCASGKW
jgi:hypothetical protein